MRCPSPYSVTHHGVSGHRDTQRPGNLSPCKWREPRTGVTISPWRACVPGKRSQRPQVPTRPAQSAARHATRSRQGLVLQAPWQSAMPGGTYIYIYIYMYIYNMYIYIYIFQHAIQIHSTCYMQKAEYVCLCENAFIYIYVYHIHIYIYIYIWHIEGIYKEYP